MEILYIPLFSMFAISLLDMEFLHAGKTPHDGLDT